MSGLRDDVEAFQISWRASRENRFSAGELAAAGTKRIGLAGSLYRAAMTGSIDAARELRDAGFFFYLDRSVTTPVLHQIMGI